MADNSAITSEALPGAVRRRESRAAVATNDVLILDRTAQRTGPSWRALTNRTFGGGPYSPLPRYRAAAALTNGSVLWVYGGLDEAGGVLDDTYAFNVTSAKWRRMNANLPGSEPPQDGSGTPGLQRASMIASPDGAYLLMYGGRNQAEVPQNRLWLLDISLASLNASVRWREVLIDIVGGAAAANPAGNDTGIQLVRTTVGNTTRTELVLVASGAWKP
ncbi:putative adagio-like protein 2 [Tetrabaena socialis]|uniref:Putative adagio-like protein 2 n=1 Tax=Tetrabaena socialis TaxID=47790 RepID=A0A2J7ZMR1_9CHLO|nr:putative adagio-like protein 2 [Tetrabaena socialis]|eukprot:PNH01547.1 putative adagio-like protein 2 [Tetrabaena socialis]